MAADDSESKDAKDISVGILPLNPINNHVAAWVDGNVEKAMEGVQEAFSQKAKDVGFVGVNCYHVHKQGWILDWLDGTWFIGLVKVSKQSELIGTEYWASIKVFQGKGEIKELNKEVSLPYILNGFYISGIDHLTFIVNNAYVVKPNFVLDQASKITNMKGGALIGFGYTRIIQDLAPVQQFCNKNVDQIKKLIGVSQEWKFDNFVVEQAFNRAVSINFGSNAAKINIGSSWNIPRYIFVTYPIGVGVDSKDGISAMVFPFIF